MSGYRALFDASLTDPTGFWADAAKAVTWTSEPQRILDDTNPPFYRWFPDGELNTCANALDRHVPERGEQTALIYDSPVTGTKATYSYRELRDATRRVRRRPAWAGSEQGRSRGDLHADGARGRHRHAGLRASRRGALGGVRRIRRARAGDPHRRRTSCRRGERVLRYRTDPHHRIQAHAGYSTGDRRAQAQGVRHPATRAVPV